MFHLRRLTETEIHAHIAAASGGGPGAPRFLAIEKGPAPGDLGTYFHDLSRSCMGHGEAAFAAAKRAFAHWQMFDLGWVRVVNSAAPIARGGIVVVEVRSLGLWSVNFSRIVETIDNQTQFGFVYAATAHHVEQGEERFLLCFDPANGEVSYELEAVSRPRHTLAKIGYPITRYFQHKFARDSHQRMRQAVTLKI